MIALVHSAHSAAQTLANRHPGLGALAAGLVIGTLIIGASIPGVLAVRAQRKRAPAAETGRLEILRPIGPVTVGRIPHSDTCPICRDASRLGLTDPEYGHDRHSGHAIHST